MTADASNTQQEGFGGGFSGKSEVAVGQCIRAWVFAGASRWVFGCSGSLVGPLCSAPWPGKKSCFYRLGGAEDEKQIYHQAATLICMFPVSARSRCSYVGVTLNMQGTAKSGRQPSCVRRVAPGPSQNRQEAASVSWRGPLTRLVSVDDTATMRLRSTSVGREDGPSLSLPHCAVCYGSA